MGGRGRQQHGVAHLLGVLFLVGLVVGLVLLAVVWLAPLIAAVIAAVLAWRWAPRPAGRALAQLAGAGLALIILCAIVPSGTGWASAYARALRCCIVQPRPPSRTLVAPGVPNVHPARFAVHPRPPASALDSAWDIFGLHIARAATASVIARGVGLALGLGVVLWALLVAMVAPRGATGPPPGSEPPPLSGLLAQRAPGEPS